MAWTAPRTWVTSELVTSSIMNVHIRDNENALARVLVADTAEVGTGAVTTEVDLLTATIAAGTMGTTGSVRITAAVNVTGANGAKTVRLYFGATVINLMDTLPAGQAGEMMIESFVRNTSASAQKVVSASMLAGSPETNDNYVTAAINTANAVIVKVTGQTANASDEVTGLFLVVEWCGG